MTPKYKNTSESFAQQDFVTSLALKVEEEQLKKASVKKSKKIDLSQFVSMNKESEDHQNQRIRWIDRIPMRAHMKELERKKVERLKRRQSRRLQTNLRVETKDRDQQRKEEDRFMNQCLSDQPLDLK